MFSNPIIQFLLKILIFILIIYVLQCGFELLKDTYTTPKVKDLVNTQIKKYQNIVSEINQQNIAKTDIENVFNSEIDVDDMNNELLSFMNSQTQQYETSTST